MPYRQLPTRDELRAAPTIAWTYLGLGVVALVITLAVLPQFGLSPMVAAIEFVAPAAFAAAIAFVAPRDRMAQLAAASFAIPVALHALAELFLVPPISQVGSETSDWANLIPTLNGLFGALSSVAWMLDIVAVFALALFIGRIKTRTGWLLLGLAVVVVAARIAIVTSQLADQVSQMGLMLSETPVQLLISPLAPLVGLGWGFLLAVAWERRFWLIALASSLQLLLTFIGLLTVTVLADWFQSAGLANSLDWQAYLFVVTVAQLTFILAMVFGILRELPRHGQSTDTAVAASQ